MIGQLSRYYSLIGPGHPPGRRHQPPAAARPPARQAGGREGRCRGRGRGAEVRGRDLRARHVPHAADLRPHPQHVLPGDLGPAAPSL